MTPLFFYHIGRTSKQNGTPQSTSLTLPLLPCTVVVLLYADSIGNMYMEDC